jgi:superfamily II DNA or RNA helicase
MKLRDYQERDVERLRGAYGEGYRRVCYQAPCGSGKTVLFAHIVRGATARGNRTLILAHRQEIVDQISDALTELGLDHAFIAAGRAENSSAPVQIASVATLVRRLDRLGAINLIVTDECHHGVASTWLKIYAAAPNAKILGVTATPLRLDGKGDQIFDHLVEGPTVEELIAGGWLVKPVCFAPERLPDLTGIRTRMGDYEVGALGERMAKPIVIQSAVDEYARLCAGTPAICFCVDIKHSVAVTEAFQARGFRAPHLDGTTPKDERRRILAALATGEIQVVGNCGIISEGLDVPGVHAVILSRPTKSLALHIQQVGRAMRPAPGKSKALILDCAGNIFQHGPPDAPHEWTLAGLDREAEKERESQRRCPGCGAIMPLSAWPCSECGTVLRQPVSERPEIETRLVPAERLASMTYRQALLWAGRSEARLRLVAKARGYKKGWVWHVLHHTEGDAA